MKRDVSLVAAVAALATCLVATSEARLPKTLNFTNLTGDRVNQTVGETASNEKEVDFGDFDQDGDLDVVVGVGFSDFGSRRNKLYRNDNGTFNEVSGAPVISGFSGLDTTRNAFFRDVDNDGWLDIYITNDSNPGNGDRMDRVYINLHPGGVFSNFDVNSASARIPGQANQGAGMTGPECSSVLIDLNDDGLVDFYGGNYPNSSQDHMYINQFGNPGFFTGVTSTNVPNDGAYTIDVATADLNGDGQIDLTVGNWGTSFVYYNNNNNAGSGTGDFKYTGSQQVLGSMGTGNNEGAFEPGDFDGDGDPDLYWSNGPGGGVSDQILVNTGNNGSNQVNWSPLTTLPPAVVGSNNSRKATVADFNRDDRMDVLVMRLNSRPVLLRNTTVNGNISFVDWTSGEAFPTGSTHRGWHAAAFDGNDDTYPDLFLGGNANDHYFENSASNELDEGTLDGTLPNIDNLDPVAVTGSVDGTDTYNIEGAGGRLISAVLTSASDLTLEVGAASSNRGGLGIEEALQTTSSAGTTIVRVIANEIMGDSDGDGDIDLDDQASFFDCETAPNVPTLLGCEIFDFDQDNDVDWHDAGGMQNHFSGFDVPASADYVLEILERTAG